MKSDPGSTSKRRLGLLALGLLLAGRAVAGTLPTVATGADVDESRVTQVLYVDPAHTEAMDDDKHGTADAPFATFNYACQAAARAKDANVGVKILLATGTYREAATIPAPLTGKPDTDAPLVVEAAEREQAVIDGADTEGWSPSTWKVEDTRWTHPWPFRRAAPARPASPTGESYRRGDLVFVNGTLLQQVNAAADLAPGCLWGELPAPVHGRHASPEHGPGAGPVAVVQPPPDTELPGAIVQVGVRNRGLTISGRRNVVVRGLLVQHAAEPGGAGEKTAGILLENCSNVLVEDVLSQWNDGVGLNISAGGTAGKNVTLRRVRLLHNGGTGLRVAGLGNLLAEDCETSFNNFRGDWAGWVDPRGEAGVEVEGVRGSTWRRQHVIGNACGGWSLVAGNTDVTLEDAIVRNNLVTGIFSEDNPGPILVRRCLVAGTKGHPSVPDHRGLLAGVALAGTPDVTLESNVIADNVAAQLSLEESTSPKSPRLERHGYRHNVFASADAGACLYRLPVSDGGAGSGFTPYYATLDAQENCFWNPMAVEGFDGYAYRPATRRTGAVYTERPLKLEDWQAAAQAEAGPGSAAKIEIGSRWQDPLFVDPAEGDYRLKQASPAADWDLPSDDAATGQ